MKLPPCFINEPGVYAIGHDELGVYVGCSKNVPARVGRHRAHLVRGIHPNKKLQAAWTATSGEGFSVCVLESTESYYAAEKKWIALFDSCFNGFNATTGGNRGFVLHDEDARNAISASKLGELNPAKRSGKAISEALTGRKLSEQTKVKISLSGKGKQLGDANPARRPEVRAKLSAAMKGKRLGPRPEHAAKLIGKVAVNNGVVCRLVQKEEAELLLAAGWSKGRKK